MRLERMKREVGGNGLENCVMLVSPIKKRKEGVKGLSYSSQPTKIYVNDKLNGL